MLKLMSSDKSIDMLIRGVGGSVTGGSVGGSVTGAVVVIGGSVTGAMVGKLEGLKLGESLGTSLSTAGATVGVRLGMSLGTGVVVAPGDGAMVGDGVVVSGANGQYCLSGGPRSLCKVQRKKMKRNKRDVFIETQRIRFDEDYSRILSIQHFDLPTRRDTCHNCL